MLLRFFLCLFVISCPWISEAKIIETSHVADALPYIDKDTWFLVDLDNTLFQAKQALGHANWFYDLLQERLNEGMDRNAAIAAFYPEWIKSQKLCAVKPLEEDFVPALIALQRRGIVVMGFTHRQPYVADSTAKQVASLGFDFTLTAPSQEIFSVPPKSPTLYSDGILYISDYNKKGDVFLSFLSIFNKKPKKVVFIDDKRKNVEEVEGVLTKEGIEYVGVYYTAIEHAKPVYSRKLADIQAKYLDTLMSNEDAEILLQHNN